MRDVFLSYASADRERARPLVEALEASGWTVWWDRQLAIGRNYEEEIQERLEASQCVVVLWSQTSVRSRWVKAEAQDAAERERLFPVFVDPVKAPLEYRYLNGVDLTQWNGSPENAEFARLLEALRSRLSRSPEPVASFDAVRPGTAAAPATAAPEATAPEEPAAPRDRNDSPSSGPGEVTAIRLVADELARILDRAVAAKRGASPARSSPDRKPGEVTLARAISRKLAQSLASFADARGRVLPSALALRYLAWSFAVPTALLLALHGAVYLFRLGP